MQDGFHFVWFSLGHPNMPSGLGMYVGYVRTDFDNL